MEKKKLLILSVGGSPEPLIYSINEFKPDMVYFMHSPETKNMCGDILEETGFEGKVEYCEIHDAESLDDSFIKSREVFSKFDNPEYDVRVDFTGGTKPMVSGVVLAVIEGNYSNFKFSYVGQKDSKSRTKKGVGVVKDGSELNKMQINPYKKYAISEFKRGKNFFNGNQYEASLKYFMEAEKSLHDGNLANEEELAHFYVKLINFYQSWDKFNEKVKFFNRKEDKYESLKLSTYLQKQIIEKMPDSFIEDFGVSEEFILQLDKNLEFLRLKLANDINKGIRYYLPDLLNNAKRKIDSGSYDDAVARLYRAIELIAQIQLNELSIMDKQKLHDNKVFYINRKQFDLETMDNHKARNYVKQLGIKDYDEREKTFKLALKNSYELLRKFDVQLARDYFADTELDRAKNRRNDSILAHGLTPLSKESACDFYKRVLDYAIKAFPDIEDYMEKAEFPKFNM